MYKKTLKSKRAISPILATLLLIVIAVAAIVVTYAWVMTFTSSTTTQAGIQLRKDSVSWSNNTVIIYVRNTGIADATLDAVYIGTSSTNLALHTNVTYNPSKVVLKEGGGTITVTVNGYSWNPQTMYYFRIVPRVGEALVFSESSPP